ncbi:hypothetical protein GCM10010873_16300 [Cypionkella aquatica]|uniref:Transcriptional regulator n=1 Tax=Cypionkella aquatica TaxID=1756042 RepID=A0AA37U0R5_9RHOB|nr:hypothetical protein [Cypionkella aquatica]GLS86656.1 hypothetical protein GCM10010873_16300 [Cypionkella aquatica]
MHKVALGLDLPDPEWVQLLRTEVDVKRRSIAAVARDIGMPRPSLSMLLSGTYPAGLDKVSAKFAAVVISKFRGQVLCPHLRKGIGIDVCKGHALAPMKMSAPDELKFWAACRACPLNPITQTKKEA